MGRGARLGNACGHGSSRRSSVRPDRRRSALRDGPGPLGVTLVRALSGRAMRPNFALEGLRRRADDTPRGRAGRPRAACAQPLVVGAGLRDRRRAHDAAAARIGDGIRDALGVGRAGAWLGRAIGHEKGAAHHASGRLLERGDLILIGGVRLRRRRRRRSAACGEECEEQRAVDFVHESRLRARCGEVNGEGQECGPGAESEMNSEAPLAVGTPVRLLRCWPQRELAVRRATPPARRDFPLSDAARNTALRESDPACARALHRRPPRSRTPPPLLAQCQPLARSPAR